jgi:ferredoxin
MGNIRPGTHKPRFGLDCSSCLRCIYACPRQAIGMKRFAAMPITGGYSFEATLAQARNAASRTEPAAGYVPPFLAGYEADDAI